MLKSFKRYNNIERIVLDFKTPNEMVKSITLKMLLRMIFLIDYLIKDRYRFPP